MIVFTYQERKFFRLQARHYRLFGNRDSFKCPRCKRGFVTRYSYFLHGFPLCYSCWQEIHGRKSFFR